MELILRGSNQTHWVILLALLGCTDTSQPEPLSDVENAYQQATSCISLEERRTRTYEPISKLLCDIPDLDEVSALERLTEAKVLLDDEHERIEKDCWRKRADYVYIAPSNEDEKIDILYEEFNSYSSSVATLRAYADAFFGTYGYTADIKKYSECRIATTLHRALTGEFIKVSELDSCDEIIQQVCG